MTTRPTLSQPTDDDEVHAFVAGLQEAIDQADAEAFNAAFAADGYDDLHATHRTLFASLPAAWRGGNERDRRKHRKFWR